MLPKGWREGRLGHTQVDKSGTDAEAGVESGYRPELATGWQRGSRKSRQVQSQRQAGVGCRQKVGTSGTSRVKQQEQISDTG